MKDRLTLLIPANKESESLPIFLKELEKFDYKKIVVLQNEDRETIESISDFKDIKIQVQNNRGYGSAIKEGIEKIETEFFCIINADGSMDPSYLNKMLNLCKDKDFVFHQSLCQTMLVALFQQILDVYNHNPLFHLS